MPNAFYLINNTKIGHIRLFCRQDLGYNVPSFDYHCFPLFCVLILLLRASCPCTLACVIVRLIFLKCTPSLPEDLFIPQRPVYQKMAQPGGCGAEPEAKRRKMDCSHLRGLIVPVLSDEEERDCQLTSVTVARYYNILLLPTTQDFEASRNKPNPKVSNSTFSCS